MHFFLEADRSTMPQARLKDKLSAYWHYLEQGLHSQKYGIRSFRVVVVTVTVARARNLCDLAAEVLPERARKYFLFTSLDHFSGETSAPLAVPIYISPRDGGVSAQPLVSDPVDSGRVAQRPPNDAGSATRLSRSYHLQ